MESISECNKAGTAARELLKSDDLKIVRLAASILDSIHKIDKMLTLVKEDV